MLLTFSRNLVRTCSIRDAYTTKQLSIMMAFTWRMLPPRPLKGARTYKGASRFPHTRECVCLVLGIICYYMMKISATLTFPTHPISCRNILVLDHSFLLALFFLHHQGQDKQYRCQTICNRFLPQGLSSMHRGRLHVLALYVCNHTHAKLYYISFSECSY